MARLSVLLLSLLLVSGSVVTGQEEDNFDISQTDSPETTTPSTTTTTPETTTTSTTTTTPETTTPSTTTTTPETTTPETTTTTPETTTPETTTTTPSTTTTTSTSTMTPTTTAPDPKVNYNVTQDNITCVMIKGDISFSVNYTLIDNTTNVVKVEVPAHGGKATGSCTGPDSTQWIQVVWGPAASSSIKLTFRKSSDNTTWTMDEFTAAILMDNNTFVNIVEEDVILDLEVYYELKPLTVPCNHSFNCHSSLSTKNVTSTIARAEYKPPVTAAMDGIQIQAFNAIPNETDFVEFVHCTADQTSDIVPIAVGCALAGLVVIVLIAYLVGRRRRSGAYQSV